MSEKLEQINYYKYSYLKDFTVIFKFNSLKLEEAFEKVLVEIGFEKLDFSQVSEIKIDGDTYFISVNSTTSQMLQRIGSQNKIQLSRTEHESIHLIGDNQVYLLKNKFFWSKTPNRLRWEVGACLNSLKIESQESVRLLMARLFSTICAEYSVFTLFGVPVEEGVVVLEAYKSCYEFMFVDVERSQITTFDGVKSFDDDLEIIRLTSESLDEPRYLKIDELYGYLMNNLAYFALGNFPKRLTGLVYEFTKYVTGVVYPEENFKPREVKGTNQSI